MKRFKSILAHLLAIIAFIMVVLPVIVLFSSVLVAFYSFEAYINTYWFIRRHILRVDIDCRMCYTEGKKIDEEGTGHD